MSSEINTSLLVTCKAVFPSVCIVFVQLVYLWLIKLLVAIIVLAH